MVSVSDHAGYVETRVVDHGPGIPATEWDNVFLPFQRLGDRDNDTGVGLGLALSRGLAEAMGGTLDPELTPGGGLTMTLRLPTAETADLSDANPPIRRCWTGSSTVEPATRPGLTPMIASSSSTTSRRSSGRCGSTCRPASTTCTSPRRRRGPARRPPPPVRI